MVFFAELWQVVAAAIAAAVALWQFAGLKDHRRAEELSQLEQSIVSAAERKDPLEHVYRAHTMKRLQVFHGNRGLSGLYAVVWVSLAVMFLLLAGITKSLSLVPQLVTFVGLTFSMVLAARYWGLWLYSTRTLHNETGEALEVAMVAARQSFIEANKHLPPLRPVPDLVNQAVTGWKNLLAKKKRDLLSFLALAGLVAAYTWFGNYALGQRWLDLKTVFTWTCTMTAVGVATFLVWSQKLEKFTTKITPPWFGKTLYWLAQIAWVAGALTFVPGWLENLIVWTVQSSHPPPGREELMLILGFIFALGFVLAWSALSTRFRRWKKQKGSLNERSPM